MDLKIQAQKMLNIGCRVPELRNYIFCLRDITINSDSTNYSYIGISEPTPILDKGVDVSTLLCCSRYKNHFESRKRLFLVTASNIIETNDSHYVTAAWYYLDPSSGSGCHHLNNSCQNK